MLVNQLSVTPTTAAFVLQAAIMASLLKSSMMSATGRMRLQPSAKPKVSLIITRRRAVQPPRAGLFDAVGKALNNAKASVAMQAAGGYDEQAVSARLKDYIANNKVVVFSWTGCPVRCWAS